MSSAFEHAVLSDLQSRGWTIGRSSTGDEGVMYRANDGGGSSFAQTVLVKESIAVVISHRGAPDLRVPWRQGHEARNGSPTFYITSRDLCVDQPEIPKAQARSIPQRSHVTDDVDHDCVAAIRAAFYAKKIPRDDHPQLQKNGAWVHTCGLREFPSGHKFAGDLLAPLFRPKNAESLFIELCGAQQLLRNTNAIPDKYIVAGSRTAGAFVPLPIRESFFSDEARIKIEDGARIVVAEGIRTAQAIRTATASWSMGKNSEDRETAVLAALTANNLPAVAAWLKSSGLSQSHEIIFAADNDLAKSGFVGIRKSVEAADLCGGRVALVDNDKSGFDAYDLLSAHKDAAAGLAAVRDFIKSARSTEQVRADRADAFSQREQAPSKEKVLSQEEWAKLKARWFSGLTR